MSELGEYAGEEHDRVGLLAVRLRIERIVVVGTDARRLFLAAVVRARGTTKRCSSPPPTKRTTI